MASCFDYYQAFPNPSGITWPFFDFEDKKLQYDVTNHLPDRQNMEFAPGNGLAVSDSCEAIAAQAINLSNAGDDALLYLYESTMESLALQEIINPIMISNGQEAATDICGPSLGVDYGERVVFPVPKSTGREEIMGCNANNLVSHTRDDGSGMEVPLGKNNTACGKRKNRKTDPYVSENVFDTNVLVPLKKSKKDSCESGASKDHEEKSNTELDVVRRDPPELLSNVVTKETKADSPKDYIHVRARRGQATDRHSLAERVRRQKISDRMNILQNLIPGCNKVTNKALLLEEIINYVQSLQIQVEILSMKLASTSYLRAFDDQITGHPFKELLSAEATTGPMIASGIAPHSVDHTRTVAQHRAPGTFG